MLASQTAEDGARTASTPSRRARLVAGALYAGLLAFAFIGRAVISSDGAEVLSVTLGFFVTGRFEAAMLPTTDVLPIPLLHSHYGLFPSLLPLPFMAAAWPLRHWLGASVLDGAVALTWALGALLSALAFTRLARVFRPDASPLWGPAFLAGTFLWPYAADSFFDPYSGALFAFSAERILGGTAPRRGRLVVAGLCWSAACWLRPILWVTAPVFFLAGLLRVRTREDSGPLGLALASGLAAGVGVALAVNWVYQGSPLHFGYVLAGDLPFWSPLGQGLYGLAFGPGRGLLFYAPLVVPAVFAWRRLTGPARVLTFGMPLVLALVIARWFVWSGGSCWGPRYLLAALPVLAAPVVLAPLVLRRGAVVAGVALNLSGVLVAPGAFIMYAESLVPPAGATWPVHGPDRVSDVASLTPLYGHPWLLARAFGGFLPAPWLAQGARETVPPPGIRDFLSPLVLRSALGVPPITPYIPKLLSRTALAYAIQGRPKEARQFANEALALDPRDRQAREVLLAIPKGN
ncbi:MAG: tetratricopeptide repeat protein [Acidobacteriota bacterium]|nr:tetratricopeptide repeat protein [Acidobacteriota bacterium]